MELRTDAQLVEYFHLAFLQVLKARMDQTRYVLKGGANLRYFFDSVRYSEDIDLDAVEIEPWKLEERVDEVLTSTALDLLLRAGSLSLLEVTKPKQTETTQRWKPIVSGTGRRAPVRTKVEFSHRTADERRVLEAVPDRIVAPYALRAPTLMHYTSAAAIEQKVEALAFRSETQARDVFDLELLFRQHRDRIKIEKIEVSTLESALERVFDLPFDAYRDQVLPFLDPEIVDLYSNTESWEQVRTFVAERLEGFR